MSIVSSLKALLSSHTVDSLAAELAKADVEIAALDQTIKDGRLALKQQGALARLKGEKSPDRRAIRDAEDALEDRKAERDGLALILEEAKVKEKADKETAARKVWDDRRAYFAPVYAGLLGVIYRARELSMAFCAGYRVDGLPNELQLRADSRPLGGGDPEADAAVAELRALGADLRQLHSSGSIYCLQNDALAAMPAMLPAIDRFLAKLTGVDLTAYMESIPDPVQIAAAAAQQAADRRAAFHDAVLKASVSFPKEHTVEEVAASSDLYSKAHNIRQWCTEYQVQAAKLDALCNSAFELSEKNLSGTRSWSVNRQVLAQAIAWQGALP